MRCKKCGLALIEECAENRPSDGVEVIRYRCMSSGDKHSYEISRRLPGFPEIRPFVFKKYKSILDAALDGEGEYETDAGA